MRSLRHALVLFAVIVVAIPLAPLAGWLAWVTFVPAYSASTFIADLRTNLTLGFYYTWDENTDRGRYLYVNGPTGSLRLAMTAFDWAHTGRTSLYLTPQREIGVLGPMDDDYVISLDPLRSHPLRRRAPNGWVYLGAFDYERSPHNERRLRFIRAEEQAECIPMRSDEDWSRRARASARHPGCP
jgi:hypothetical protein